MPAGDDESDPDAVDPRGLDETGDDRREGTGEDDRGPERGADERSDAPPNEGRAGGPREQESSNETPEPLRRPEAERPADRDSRGVIRWFLETDHPGVTFLREFVWSALIVVLIGVLLFAISGVWPPMVAVESGSMEPHLHRGDLVFVMDNGRLVPRGAVHGTGVVPYQVGKRTGYRSIGSYGDVIIYRKNGLTGATPIIHRARFWVSDGENWYDEAKAAYVPGNSCRDIPNCPAPHAGFITKGDANGQYDQVNGISEPVKPSWIVGTAELRIPWLGYVRLKLATLTIPRRVVAG